MKRIYNWIYKQEVYAVLLFLTVYLFIIELIPIKGMDDDVRNLINTIAIPIFMTLLYKAINIKMKNISFNIDLSLQKSVQNRFVWKEDDEELRNKHFYVKAKNTGDVNLLDLSMRIIFNSAGMLDITICEMIKCGECIYVKAYGDIKDVSKVIVSCGLKSDCRTKSFMKVKKMKKGHYYFSESIKTSERKKAVLFEEGFKENEKMYVKQWEC